MTGAARMTCSACGCEWEDKAVFCGECGAPIASRGPQSSPFAPAVAAAFGGAAPARPVAEAAKAVNGKEPRSSDSGLHRELKAKREVKPLGKRARRGATTEDQKLLDDLDAGFESIMSLEEPLPSAPALPDTEPVTSRSAALSGASPERAPPSAASGPSIAGLPAERIAPTPALDPAREAAREAARAAEHASNMAAARALFEDLAQGYARPLRDLVIEARAVEPSREWLDVCTPAVGALRRAAQALELPELERGLEALLAAFELASGLGTPVIGGEARELLTSTYARLVELMPRVFSLEAERGQRDPIIVRSLLLQVPGVRQVALEKMHAAGLSSLEMFSAAKPRDLADVTGLPLAVGAAICAKFAAYRSEMAALPPVGERAGERRRLASLVADLRRLHDEYEVAAAAWSPDAVARRAGLRNARTDALLQINVFLARLGEVERVKALEKVPFQQKIRELERYLEEASRKAAAS